MDHANELKRRVEQEFAEYKSGHNSLKHELSQIGHKAREETAVREAKRAIKSEFKSRMELFEKQC